MGLAKHHELRFGSHAQEVEETLPAKFQTTPTLGRYLTAEAPNRVPGEFPDFGLSWTQQISARERPLANRCCGIEEEAEDYLPSKYLAERVRFHPHLTFGHEHNLAEIPCLPGKWSVHQNLAQKWFPAKL